jgi:hypothetical protein
LLGLVRFCDLQAKSALIVKSVLHSDVEGAALGRTGQPPGHQGNPSGGLDNS